MDPTQVASATSLLTAFGFGKYAAGIVSLVALALSIASQVMPYLPVPHSTSARWYQVAYGLLARVVGNRGNSSPMPPAGTQPAGGIVPTPPPLKPAA